MLENYFEESANVKLAFIKSEKGNLERVITLITNQLRNGNKVLTCGNGGSAADAQHFAAELVVRYKLERPSIPAIALTTDTSIITASGNDYGFDHIFERQVGGLGREGDVLIAISTSGNSKNVELAVRKAKEIGLKTVGLLGKGGGKIKDIVDIPLIVPSDDTPRIQECHETIIHTICEEVERRLFDDNTE